MCASVRILGNLRGEWVSESFLCFFNRCSFLRFLSGFEVEFGCQCQEIAYHGGLESIFFAASQRFTSVEDSSSASPRCALFVRVHQLFR